MIKSFVFLLTISILTPTIAATTKDADIPPPEPKIKNMFDCDTYEWFKNCSQVNKTINEHPSAHIRVITKDNHEFNFPPGTPTPVIRHMTELSPSSAKALADYYESVSIKTAKAATLWTNEMNRRKGIANSLSLQDLYVPTKGKIDYENVSLYVFYDSNCPACKLLFPGLKNIKKRHKKLNIVAIQMNDDKKARLKINKEFELKATIANKKVKRKYGKFVTVYPTLWFQNKLSKKRSITKGYAPENIIENRLRETSK